MMYKIVHSYVGHSQIFWKTISKKLLQKLNLVYGCVLCGDVEKGNNF